MVYAPELRAPLELVDQQFRILIENALHVTAIVQCDGRIRYVSPAVERMLGYTPEQLIGSSFLVLVHPEDAGVIRSILDAYGNNAPTGRFVEFRALHRDNSLRILVGHLTPGLPW